MEQQDTFGYQIIKELERQSRQVFSPWERTPYPFLNSLEQIGTLAGARGASSMRDRIGYYFGSHT